MISITKDLRTKLGGARDQGSRPTCLCFATSDTHAAIRIQPFVPLSVEYLYYMTVRRTFQPPSSTGVSQDSVSTALNLDGQPIEAVWQYLAALPSPITTWSPPQTSQLFKRNMSKQSFTTNALVHALDNDSPVVLVIKITNGFYIPDAEGFVNSPKNDPDSGTHAVVAVGYGMKGITQVFLVRNSWGNDWGIDGHGWVTADYLTSKASSIFC